MAEDFRWTRDELVLALAVYRGLRSGPISSNLREVKELSETLRQLNRPAARRWYNFRSPDAVSMKLMAFASLDPSSGRRSRGRHGKVLPDVWKSFRSHSKAELQALAKRIEDRSH